jgi:hypothetical protein
MRWLLDVGIPDHITLASVEKLYIFKKHRLTYILFGTGNMYLLSNYKGFIETIGIKAYYYL